MISHPVFQNIRSLNAKFLLIVLLPVIISTLIMIAANGLFKYWDMQKEFSIAMSNFAKSQSSVLAIRLWNYDTEGLNHGLDTLILYPGISKAVVYNVKNEVMGEVKKSELSNIPKKLKQIKYPMSVKTPYREQHIGYLIIFYHFNEIHNRLTNQFLRDSFILFFFVIIIVAGAAIANRLIIGIPLERFIYSVQKADTDNIHEPVNWPAHDEIGRSISAYNDLLANLTAKEQSLKQSEARLTSTLEELRERERVLSTLMSNLPGMAYRCKNDKDWTMKFVSNGCCELTGYMPSMLIDNNVISYKDLIHRDDREFVCAQVQEALKQKQSFEISYRLIHKNGQQKWIWEKGVGIFEKKGKPHAIEGFISDISKMKYAEESLKLAKKTAEKARIEADTANRAKSTFLANMSHELRTPMNAILGFSQLISHDKSLAFEHQKHLSIIRRSGEHLLTLINDVLDVSKLEAGKTTLNENIFNLYHLLDEMKDMLEQRAEKKGLSLLVKYDFDVPKYIKTDETKLRQVLINLTGNAIKFTQQGEVQLSVSSEQLAVNSEKLETDNCLLITVKDTGPGIEPDEMETLFEAFRQTRTGMQVQEGTGLGLAISQKFVQLMGGEIKVRSEVGKGTTFFFDIRVHLVDAMEIENKSCIQRAVSLDPGQPRLKILIVDDNMNNRKLILNILDPFGFELREAANGQEAVEIWQNWRPELIWLDIRMPVMDGYEAVNAIRDIENNNPNLSKTIIIAQTAGTLEDERKIVIEAGFDDFLRKPFRDSDIYELMHRHMDVRFIYEDLETKKQHESKSKTITPEDLFTVTDDILKRLKPAAVDADMEKVEDIINEISEINPDLADKLAALAEDFEYGTIANIINQGI